MTDPVFSKVFSQKLLNCFKEDERKDICKAIERVMVNPEIDSYKRDYLTPYKQEHPTNKQITLFFKIISKDKIFFVWINDKTCLHTTRTPKEDPCIKEFNRLRDNNELEIYDKNIHEGEFKIKPRDDFPHFMSFKKYDATLYSTVLNDGNAFYSMNINCMEDEVEIFDHYELYLKEIRQHFKKQKTHFEFRIFDFEVDLIQKITSVVKTSEWKIFNENGLVIFKIH